MPSSNTYSFDPAFSTVVQQAYARIGVRRPAITTEHLIDAGNEGNLLLSQWASDQPLLWKSELVSLPLIQGTATYTLDKWMVTPLLVYIETGSGTGTTDRVLGPLSTVEYASIPNKVQQATPTSFWFNRQTTPTITFWQTPDGNGPYTAMIRAVTQVQDVSLPSGVTLDVPYRALDAFVAGLSHRLARIHRPELEQQRKADADEAWMKFTENDTENVPFFIAPALGGYFR